MHARLDAVGSHHRLPVQLHRRVAVVAGPRDLDGLPVLLHLAHAVDVVLVELEAVLRVLDEQNLVVLDQLLEGDAVIVSDLDQEVARLYHVVGVGDLDDRGWRRGRGHDDLFFAHERQGAHGDDDDQHDADQPDGHVAGAGVPVIIGGLDGGGAAAEIGQDAPLGWGKETLTDSERTA